MFIGLIASQQDQNQKKNKNKKGDTVEEMDEDEDDDFSDEGFEGAPLQDKDKVEQDSSAPVPLEPMAEKLWAFCDDPEERITFFLSQMMFIKGWR